MTPEQAAALRAPFPAEAIGKLPKPYRSESEKGNCNVCGGYHGLPAAHLDYVGHAATTDRLLSVDPEWTWEPFALHPQSGLPLLDEKGNLWIRMTVCGVTRIGVGDGKSLKECIGDAIRNAAMRFGVAIDLWSKEDLQAMREERGEAPARDTVLEAAQVAVQQAWAKARGEWDFAAVAKAYEEQFPGARIMEADAVSLHAFAATLLREVEAPAIEGTIVPAEPVSA